MTYTTHSKLKVRSLLSHLRPYNSVGDMTHADLHNCCSALPSLFVKTAVKHHLRHIFGWGMRAHLKACSSVCLALQKEG